MPVVSPEPLLRITLDPTSRMALEKLAEELPRAPMNFQSSFSRLVRDWQAEIADELTAAFRDFHLSSPAPGKRQRMAAGRSYRSIRHYTGHDLHGQSVTGRWDVIGYYPQGELLIDSIAGRNVLAYWGGRSGQKDFYGPLMTGMAPGALRAPLHGGGGGGGGVFGSEEAYQRLINWAISKGIKREETKTRKEPRRGRVGRRRIVKEKAYYQDKKLVWILVRAMEKKGLVEDPVLGNFAIQDLPRLEDQAYEQLFGKMKDWVLRLQQITQKATVSKAGRGKLPWEE